jgi:glutamyl-tRNA synthetase
MIEITAPVRVRFAPSPTGFLHIGGVRTALFNWLFARHYGGQFILRVEDTDEKRYVPGAAEDMMNSLRWVGIDWDEGPDIGGQYGPYVQSERHALGIYQKHIDQLLADGKAYKSFVTEQELEQMRADAAARGIKSFRYRGAERDWAPEQVAAAEASGKPFTVRLKTPLDGTTSFSYLIRGGDRITVNNSELQDIVLVKSSGMPLYHLAHLVDDHEMAVTHVLRAEEWVPSAPYHVLLYQAFGWSPPVFAHVPAILRQDGKGKLSKRKDDVATNRFWERGYLAEAMFNYLALQGWSYDDHTEIMSRDEVVERFTIDRVQASPARWNPDKLKDMNGIYIRRLAPAEVAERIAPFLSRAGLIGEPPSETERAYVERLVPLVHERLEELGDAPELLEFFFRDVAPARGAAALEYDPALLIPKKLDGAGTVAALRAAYDALAALVPWSEGQLEEALRALAEQLELKPGQLFGALRVAITGRTVAPPLFETMAALGKQRGLARIAAARDALNAS